MHIALIYSRYEGMEGIMKACEECGAQITEMWFQGECNDLYSCKCHDDDEE